MEKFKSEYYKPHEIYGDSAQDPTSEIRMNKLRERIKAAKAKKALPKYKVEEKDPSYKMKRGIVMRATSDLHDDENGKRFITTNMKVWKDLTPKDKSSLKKSIMVALDHNFKGGSINDIPKDLHKIIDKVNDHIKKMNGYGFGTNYLKPKGARQMIFFDSDTDSETSSSDDDRMYLPIKRGRGRPRKYQ